MILDKIVEQRKNQLLREKQGLPNIQALAENVKTPCRDFAKSILDKKEVEYPAIIAEIKKASPSKGLINNDFRPLQTAHIYEACGAGAVSVLTEEHYFLGNNEFLRDISQEVSIPVLRKDFIIDPFQIYHARVLGADAVLLIAAILETGQIKEFLQIAHSLGMQCLCEAHNEREAERIMEAGAEIAGINNRDLKTFQVDLKTTQRLMNIVKNARVKVSESGISSHEHMKQVKDFGADAVLIGEAFMASKDIKREFYRLRGGKKGEN